jgi:hypothetical protein
MFTGQEASAMPGFARQTGMPCNACHFQTFPALGSMGRGFKMGGYTMEGSQASIEGENALKLPDTLNIGGVIKVRHEKTGGDYTSTGSATDYGEIQFPDEAAFLAGGRLSANAGFLWEIGMVSGDAGLSNAKFVFNAAKVGDIQIQVTPYSGATPSYGGEYMNTGALALQRIAEDKSYMSAFQLGFDDHGGCGINIGAVASNWAVMYNMFAPFNPLTDGAQPGNLTGLATYLRVNYFMDLAGFDTGFGFGTASGTAKTLSGTTEVKVAPAATFFDVQLQGQLAGMDTGFYITSGSAPKAGSDATTTYIYGDGAYAKSATGLAAKVGVTPELFVTVQSGSADEGAANAAGTAAAGATSMSSVGIQYMIAQNIKFEFTNRTKAPAEGDSETLQQMMLFIGL